MSGEEQVRLEQLVSRWLDGDLNAAGFSELEAMLLRDAAARRLYRRCMAMHMDLSEAGPAQVALTEELAQLPPPETLPMRYASMRKMLHLLQVAAAALVLLCGALIYHRVPAASRPLSTAAAVEPALPLIASVVSAAGAVWEGGRQFRAGDGLAAGTLSLVSGDVTLQIDSGVRMMLAGPAELELVSPMRAVLRRGRMTARVEETARGFSVDTPGAVIVDLGTEFAVTVGGDGLSRVCVYEGEVEASVLDAKGVTIRNVRLLAADAAELRSETASVTALTQPFDGFVRLPRFHGDDLPAGAAYAKAIQDARPIGYWRFDRTIDGHIPNEMGSRWGGTLSGSAHRGEDGSRRSLVFPEDGRGMFLVDTPIAGINTSGEYSLEVWVNPAVKNNMALVSLVDPSPVSGDVRTGGAMYKHLAYLELCGRPYERRHLPYDIRVTHRFPAAAGYGYNAYAGQAYETGEWSHLVAVRDREHLSLFVNGQLCRSVDCAAGGDDKSYQLAVGRLDPLRVTRGFAGILDELAVYDRALTADEVRSHYQLIRTNGAQGE